MSHVPPDQEARETAARVFDRNLVVSAGAGTGKTSLLVERALNALAGGHLRAQALAAITFTEKAAGEMRQRLAEGLDGIRALATDPDADVRGESRRSFDYLTGSDASPGTIADNALAALRDLEQARVMTIHAFCAEMLRQFPVEAGVAPNFEIDRGERVAALIETAWSNFLAEDLGAESGHAAEWAALLSRFPMGRIRQAAIALGGFSIPPDLLGSGYRKRTIPEVFGAEIEDALAGIGSLLDRQEGMSGKPLRFFAAAREALGAAGDGEAFREACERHAKDFESRPEANKRLRNVTVAEFDDAAGAAYELIRDLRRVDETAIGTLVEVVSGFALRFRETLLEAGLVSFDALLVLARNLLRDHPGVRESMKRRFRMLLVDEFQDTDPLQYEIVMFLAEKEGSVAVDAYSADLAPGRLFVVGDPKQSIYRFRGADYSAFRLASERIAPVPEQRLDLVSNFRGVRTVVDPVNDLFGAGSSWRPSDQQPRYDPIEPTIAAADSASRVELWTVNAGEGARADERRQAEGRCVAEEIRLLVDESGYRYGDVYILLRAFSPIGHYLRPLREWGIPFVVDGGRDFLERTEVVQLRAVLRALARPSDPVAALAYLRSPAAGVPDDELARFASDHRSWSWRQEDVDASRYPAIGRAYRLLRDIWKETRDLSTDDTVLRVLRRTQLLPLAAFGFEGAQRVANLRKLAAAARGLAWDGTLSFNEILDALHDAQTSDIEGDSPLADEATNAVRVATVHKAKGLENKIVFVPDLARQKGTGPPSELETGVERRDPNAPTLAIRAKEGMNLSWAAHARENKRHEDAEEIRTLYVAMTRAQERLILLAGRANGEAPWLDALATWGYDADNPPDDGAVLDRGRVRHRVVVAGAPPKTIETTRGTDRSTVERYEEAVATLARLARPPIERPSITGEHDAPTDALAGWRGPRRGRSAARAVGTVVHRALEKWDLARPEGLLAPVASLAAAAASDEGIDRAEVERDARAVLERFADSPLASRLREVRVLGREVPMLYRDADQRSWTGTIDLVYEDPSTGEVVVADFKTDRDLDDGTARERYGEQLRVYAAAVSSSLSLSSPPDAELWMLRDGRVISL